MKINGQLKAFTILELTVAMLITALVVGISYTAYTMVSRSYKDYDGRNRNLSELLTCDKILRKDFAAAARITAGNHAIVLDEPWGKVEYEFKEAYITRNQYQLKTDTFFIPVSRLDISFENHPSGEGTYADCLRFKTKVNGEVAEKIYTKKYSAEEMVQLITHNP